MSRDCGPRDYPFRYWGEKMWAAECIARKVEPMSSVLDSWAEESEFKPGRMLDLGYGVRMRVFERVEAPVYSPEGLPFWSNDPDQYDLTPDERVDRDLDAYDIREYDRCCSCGAWDCEFA